MLFRRALGCRARSMVVSTNEEPVGWIIYVIFDRLDKGGKTTSSKYLYNQLDGGAQEPIRQPIIDTRYFQNGFASRYDGKLGVQ